MMRLRLQLSSIILEQTRWKRLLHQIRVAISSTWVLINTLSVVVELCIAVLK